MSSDKNLEEIVEGLQGRISILQLQYTGFVRLCVDLIKVHRVHLDEELKSDPNTPREMIQVIQQHSKDLEKKIIQAGRKDPTVIASSGNFALDEFRQQIIQIIEKKAALEVKKILANKVFDKISLEFGTDRQTSEEISTFSISNGVSLIIPELDISKNLKSLTEIKELKEKNYKLTTILKEKDLKLQSLYSRLERLKNNNPSAKSQSNSAQNKSPFLLGFSQTASPATEYMNFSSCADNELSDLRFFSKTVQEKVYEVEKLLESFNKKAISIQKTLRTQCPELNSLFEDFQCHKEKIEKAIDDIVTPRFQTKKSDKEIDQGEQGKKIEEMQKELESAVKERENKENEIEEIRKNYEQILLEVKQLHSIILASKRNSKNIEKENERLKKQFKESQGYIGKHSNRDEDKCKCFDTQDRKLKIFGKNLKREKMSICATAGIEISQTYKYQNIIKEMMKQLMEKERALYEKNENIFQSARDNQRCKDSQTQTRSKKPSIDLQIIKIEDSIGLLEDINKFSQSNELKLKAEKYQAEQKKFFENLLIENKELTCEMKRLEQELIGKSLKINMENNLSVGMCDSVFIPPIVKLTDMEENKKNNKKMLKKEEKERFLNELKEKLEQDELTIMVLRENLDFYKANEQNIYSNSTRNLSITKGVEFNIDSKIGINKKPLLESLQPDTIQQKKTLQDFSHCLLQSLEKCQISCFSRLESILFKLNHSIPKAISKFKSIHSEIQCTNKALHMQLKSQIDSIKSLEKAIQILSSSKETSEKNLKVLQEFNEKLASQINSQAEDLKSNQKALETIYFKLEDSELELTLLNGQLQKYKQIETNLTQSVKESASELLKYKSLLYDSDKQIKVFQEEISKLNFKVHTKSRNSIEICKEELLKVKAKNIELEEKFKENQELSDINEVKLHYQDQINMLINELKTMEKNWKESEKSFIKERENMQKTLESYAKQLAVAQTEISDLKGITSGIENDSSINLESIGDFEVVRAVTHEGITWFLLKILSLEIFMWSNAEIPTDVRDATLDLTEKIIELQKINAQTTGKLKDIYKELELVENTSTKKGYTEILQILSKKNTEEPCQDLVKSRDELIDQFLDDLKSPRGQINYEEPEDPRHKASHSDESLFTISSCEKNYDQDQDLQKLLTQQNLNLAEKENTIHKLEFMIIDLKEKNNKTLENMEKLRNIVEKHLEAHPLSQKNTPFLEALRDGFGIKSLSKLPPRYKK